MLIERQVPTLAIRGSIFNVTAKYMEEQDKRDLETLVDNILGKLPPSVVNKFQRRLRNTIGADYNVEADNLNESATYNELRIAVWKAAVHLKYHCDYEFYCQNCSNTHYVNNNDRVSKIDRQTVYCPSCGHCAIEDSGDSDFEVGDFVEKAIASHTIEEMEGRGLEPPQYSSCIAYRKGDRKVENYEDILQDEEQTIRFTSRVVDNYCQQLIKENGIRKHCVNTSCELAEDLLVINLFVAFLKKIEVPYTYDQHAPIINGYHYINCNLMGLPPRFIPEISAIYHKTRTWNTEIVTDNKGVWVKDLGADAVVREASMVTKEIVTIETSVSDSSQENGNTEKLLTLKDKTMAGTNLIDFQDSLEVMHGKISEEASVVLNILTQVGRDYEDFISQFDKPKPHKSDIAQFLKVRPSGVKKIYQELKAACSTTMPILCQDEEL